MRQRFEYSFAAAYLALVSLGYLTIGAFGAFWHFPPTPNLMAQFLMVDPYPLLHFAAGCTFRFPCTIFDLPYDFYGPGYPEVEFAGISQVVFSLGLLSGFAKSARNQSEGIGMNNFLS